MLGVKPFESKQFVHKKNSKMNSVIKSDCDGGGDSTTDEDEEINHQKESIKRVHFSNYLQMNHNNESAIEEEITSEEEGGEEMTSGEEEGGENSEEEEGDENNEEEEKEDENSEEEKEIRVNLHGNSFLKQMKEIMDLRDLHKRVNSRLSWATDVGQSLLKKEENKISHFFDDEQVQSEENHLTDNSEEEDLDEVESSMESGGDNGNQSISLSPNPKLGANFLFTNSVSNGIPVSSVAASAPENEPDDPGDIIVLKAPPKKKVISKCSSDNYLLSKGGPSDKAPSNMTVASNCPSDQYCVQKEKYPSVEGLPSSCEKLFEADVKKKPFLKKRSGLLRFYRTESKAYALSPGTSKQQRSSSSTPNPSPDTNRTESKTIPPSPRTSRKQYSSPLHSNSETTTRPKALRSRGSSSHKNFKKGKKVNAPLAELPSKIKSVPQKPVAQGPCQPDTNKKVEEVQLVTHNRIDDIPSVFPQGLEVLSDSTSSLDEDNDAFLELKELKIFEKMEQLTGRSSFGSQASFVGRFMEDDLSMDESHVDTAAEDVPSSSQVYETDECYDKLRLYIRRKLSETETNAPASIEEMRRQAMEISANLDDLLADIKLPPNTSLSYAEFNKIWEHLLRRRDSASQTPHQNLDRTLSYTICKDNQPDDINETMMMVRLHQQQRLTKYLREEKQRLLRYREELEEKDLELKETKKEFEKFKEQELENLENYRKQLESKSQGLEKISMEGQRFRELNLEYQVKIKALNDQLKNVETELQRKTNRWEATQKKLEDRIKHLEKEKADFESNKSVSPILKSSDRNVIDKIQTKPHSATKVQFASDNKNLLGTTNKPASSFQPQATNSKASKSVGYFSSAQSNLKGPVVQKKTSRTSMIPTPPKSNVKASENRINCVKKIDNQDASTLTSPSLMILSCNEEMANLDKIPRAQCVDDDVKISNSKTYQNTNGDVEVVCPNGTRKYISKANNFTRIVYTNGDILETRADGSRQYFYTELGIRQYTYPNGLTMTTYSNGQIERKNPDGSTEMLFTNGTVKFDRANGQEEYIFPDNTIYQVDPNGDAVLFLPNGQKEVHGSECNKRIFPDGTMKTAYKDGTLETQYPNGRIRIRDSKGNLSSDTIEIDGIRVPFVE